MSSSTGVLAPCPGLGRVASCTAGSAEPGGSSQAVDEGSAAPSARAVAGPGDARSSASPSPGTPDPVPGCATGAADEGGAATGASADTCGSGAGAGSCAGSEGPGQALRSPRSPGRTAGAAEEGPAAAPGPSEARNIGTASSAACGLPGAAPESGAPSALDPPTGLQQACRVSAGAPAVAAGSAGTAAACPPGPDGGPPATGPPGAGTAAGAPNNAEATVLSPGSEREPSATGAALATTARGTPGHGCAHAPRAEQRVPARGPAPALGPEQGASAVGPPGAGPGASASGAEGAASKTFPLSLEWLRHEPEEDLRRILMGIAGVRFMERPQLLDCACCAHGLQSCINVTASQAPALLGGCLLSSNLRHDDSLQWDVCLLLHTSRPGAQQRGGHPAAVAGSKLRPCIKPYINAGLGRKSVACILLLSLGLKDFPVDTNVGRICARLGWIPLDSEQALEARAPVSFLVAGVVEPSWRALGECDMLWRFLFVGEAICMWGHAAVMQPTMCEAQELRTGHACAGHGSLCT